MTPAPGVVSEPADRLESLGGEEAVAHLVAPGGQPSAVGRREVLVLAGGNVVTVVPLALLDLFDDLFELVVFPIKVVVGPLREVQVFLAVIDVLVDVS